ncbi:MAG: type II toxin-antitoxin system prevent-host-death family antitoxin [Candidatus Delongbacteria bacterium]|nr:type II toxin-antitoxin system prevent-host-death family antitoxin [Candidatus Delongbacteria bacterium]
MNAINYTDLRQNLKSYMDSVYKDHEPLIVTRKDNQNVVLISLEDYNSLTETQYILSSQNNANRLLRSLSDARNGKTFTKELIEE